MKRFTPLLLLLLSLNSLASDISSDLEAFWKDLNFSSNISTPKVWQDQEAGYASGGSMYLRTRVRDVQLIHIDTPRISSGCNGIDAYLGGVSYIKDPEQLIKLAKQIMSNMAAYAFNVALESTVPHLKYVKDQLQNIEQTVNRFNINSCEMAENLVGGIFPKIGRSQQILCRDIGHHKGTFSDWAAAIQGCKQEDKFKKTLSESSGNHGNERIYNKNLVWEALKKSPLMSENKALAELVMSLTGTLIFDAVGKVTIVPPKMKQNNLAHALLYGGDVNLWGCENAEKSKGIMGMFKNTLMPQGGLGACMKPVDDTVVLSEKETLLPFTRQVILDLVTAVNDDVALSASEKGFLASTSVPILKLVTVLLSQRLSSEVLNLTDYAEFIATDFLEHYLLDLLDVTTKELSTTTYPSELQARLEKNLKHAMLSVTQLHVKTSHRMNALLNLIEHTRSLESQAGANVITQFNNTM